MPPLPCVLSILAVLGLSSAAPAGVPAVVTDIPPVQGIVAAVMEGVGMPEVAMGGGADPHHGALRPSEARALAQADMVVWVGPQLSPSFTRAVGALAGGATLIALTDKAKIEAGLAARALPGTQAVDPVLLGELVTVAFSQRRKLLRHTLGR